MADPAPRVLVVDDERFFREAIRDALLEAGIDCEAVSTGEQALSAAQDPEVGAVVLDVTLGDTSGIEVLRRLREERPAVRVIMYESGFKDFLGEDHFVSQEQAIDQLFETVIDPAICCYSCPHRVFAECHREHQSMAPRRRSLPLHRLISEAERLPRDRPLLLICRSGRRSERAMRILLDLGFEDVQNLKGGILSWKAADRPLEVE